MDNEDTQVLGQTDEQLTTNAVLAVIEKIRRNGYMTGTNLVLVREDEPKFAGWCIYDLEEELLFTSSVLLPAIHQFVRMETPEIIISICSRPKR